MYAATSLSILHWWHLGCCNDFAVVNNAAVNIQLSFQRGVFVSVKYNPRRGIAGSYV